MNVVFMNPISLAVRMTCGEVKFEDTPVLLQRDDDREYNWVPLWFAIGALRQQVDKETRMAAKKKPVLLDKHKESGAKKAKRAKLSKPVPVPVLKWGEKK